MSVQWGLPLLKNCLPNEMYERIHTAAVDPYFEPPDPGVMPTRNGATGELLKDIPLLRMYRVSRRRFRKLCAEGIDIQVGVHAPSREAIAKNGLLVWQSVERCHIQ